MCSMIHIIFPKNLAVKDFSQSMHFHCWVHLLVILLKSRVVLKLGLITLSGMYQLQEKKTCLNMYGSMTSATVYYNTGRSSYTPVLINHWHTGSSKSLTLGEINLWCQHYFVGIGRSNDNLKSEFGNWLTHAWCIIISEPWLLKSKLPFISPLSDQKGIDCLRWMYLCNSKLGCHTRGHCRWSWISDSKIIN